MKKIAIHISFVIAILKLILVDRKKWRSPTRHNNKSLRLFLSQQGAGHFRDNNKRLNSYRELMSHSY